MAGDGSSRADQGRAVLLHGPVPERRLSGMLETYLSRPEDSKKVGVGFKSWMKHTVPVRGVW